MFLRWASICWGLERICFPRDGIVWTIICISILFCIGVQGYDNGANSDNERFWPLSSTDESGLYVRLARVSTLVPWLYSIMYTDMVLKNRNYGKEWRPGPNLPGTLSLLYDSRDFLTNAYKGYYLRIDQRFSPAFSEINMRLAVPNWIPGIISPYGKALTFWRDSFIHCSIGNPTRGTVGNAGSSYSMRGYYEGRYRDKIFYGYANWTSPTYGNGMGGCMGREQDCFSKEFSEFDIETYSSLIMASGYRWEFKKGECTFGFRVWQTSDRIYI